MRKAITLLLLILFGINLSIFGGTEKLNDRVVDQSNYFYYNINEDSPSSKSKLSDWIAILTTVATFISLLLIWTNVKKQIAATETNVKKQITATETNMLKQYNLDQNKLLLENLASLIAELSKPDNGNILRHKYVSPEHLLLEYKVILLLDSSKILEKNLKTSLERFKTKQILDKNNWLQQIVNEAQIVLNNRIN